MGALQTQILIFRRQLNVLRRNAGDALQDADTEWEAGLFLQGSQLLLHPNSVNSSLILLLNSWPVTLAP
jgi:hypothetical protein